MIKNNYSELLSLAKELDSYFKTRKKGWGRPELKKKKKDAYMKSREILESKIPEWMGNIRKTINSIPAEARKSVRLQRTHPETQETYYETSYENMDYEALTKFFGHITYAVEGHGGVLAALKESNPVYSKLAIVRGDVLSLCESIELFVPEIMITIEQQVDLIFKLRDNGMTEIATLIEEIDQTDDNYKKCSNARTALEKMIQSFLEHKSIEVKRGFHTNLDNAIKAGLADKGRRVAIAGHYSFVSRIIHHEMDANIKNTRFAVDGVLNILRDLLQRQ